MSVSIMQYPSDGKLSLQMRGDRKSVSVQKEGKVVHLNFIIVVDPNDHHVRMLGNWAVEEHNSQTGSLLEFKSVIGGYKNEDEGATNYCLYILTQDKGVYEVVIEEIMNPKPTTTLLLFTEKK